MNQATENKHSPRMEMNLEEYGVMYEIEEDYWWYRGLRHIVFSLLNRYYQDMTHLAVLDAGCGTGAIMQRLPQLGHCLGFDYSAEALKFCCERGIDTARLALASVEALPYRSNTFDLVTSFDVLCCVDQDEQSLREFQRVLKPGGRLMMNLPALPILSGEHDKAVNIKRRYTAQEVKAKVEEAGFVIDKLSYVNFLLFPVALLVRLRSRLSLGSKSTFSSDLKPLPPALNGLLARVFSMEAALLKFMSFPVGVSVLCLARKP